MSTPLAKIILGAEKQKHITKKHQDISSSFLVTINPNIRPSEVLAWSPERQNQFMVCIAAFMIAVRSSGGSLLKDKNNNSPRIVAAKGRIEVGKEGHQGPHLHAIFTTDKWCHLDGAKIRELFEEAIQYHSKNGVHLNIEPIDTGGYARVMAYAAKQANSLAV